MDLVFKVYLVTVSCILVVGIWLLIPHNTVHPIGLNSTRINETSCRYTWLGGTDYDSFVENLTVDNRSIGHPPAGSVIHEGNCSSVVRMYMRDLRTFVQLYPDAWGQ